MDLSADQVKSQKIHVENEIDILMRSIAIDFSADQSV